MGKEIILIFISMLSLLSMKMGTIGNNNNTTGGKPGLSWTPWKVLVGKLETLQTEKRKTEYKHLEIMLQ